MIGNFFGRIMQFSALQGSVMSVAEEFLQCQILQSVIYLYQGQFESAINNLMSLDSYAHIPECQFLLADMYIAASDEAKGNKNALDVALQVVNKISVAEFNSLNKLYKAKILRRSTMFPPAAEHLSDLVTQPENCEFDTTGVLFEFALLNLERGNEEQSRSLFQKVYSRSANFKISRLTSDLCKNCHSVISLPVFKRRLEKFGGTAKLT